MLGPIDVMCEPKYDVFLLIRTYWNPEKVWALGDVDKEAKTLTEKGNLTYKISDWSDYEQLTVQDKFGMPRDRQKIYQTRRDNNLSGIRLIAGWKLSILC